ncbi:membrane protein [Bacillus ectoiniformans]|uniref:YihY/virulence factor BrkB family protein n=1 Tax=Bacillus ectoiniformans TaxID=1494429 RepID=UPI001EF864FA|nr:YihY/virulence factor BrkB family protein [Bacillus ectoiniformans]MBM7650223.1 membrane protein [Bacillus ectoiniformans]
MNLDKTEMRVFFKHLIKRIKASDVTGVAAQMSYFFLLSLFPLLIFMVTLLAFLPVSTEDMLGLVRDYAPGESMSMVEETLSEVMDNQNGGLLSVGILATLWSASNGMNAVIKGLNYAYNVEESRPFYKARGLSVILTVGLIVVVGAALILQVFGKQVGIVATESIGLSDGFLTIWNWVRWLIFPLLLFGVFVGLYYLAPNLDVKCVTVFPGAVFAAAGWIITSVGFSFYVNNFGNYSATYGSIGGIIILMIWMYLSAIIILVGGEINALRNEQKGITE